MSQQYSNLEVDTHANAPEVFPYYAPQALYPHPDDDTSKVAYASESAYEQPQVATICGLRRRTFWIIAIAATIAVLAAVGGGIGGALGSRASASNGSSDAQTSATLQSPSSTALDSSSRPTPTSAEPSKTVTTTTIIGPTATILRDCPSSDGTLHDVTLGGTMYFRKACGTSQVNPNGAWNAVQGITKTLDACIDLCASYNNMNKTRIQRGENRICNTVCWRNTFDKINDWEGGHCFGFLSTNSSGTFNFKQPAETRCDSAALINQDQFLEL